VTNQEFKQKLSRYEAYLKPDLFRVLFEDAEIFSESTKEEIINKLKEADSQVKELHDAQIKRNNILKRGMEKMNQIFQSIKVRFESEKKAEQSNDIRQADQLISNL